MKTDLHPVTPEEVMALADGELSPEAMATVSAHLNECPECRAILVNIESLRSKLALWTVEEASQGLAGRAKLLAGPPSGRPLFKAPVRGGGRGWLRPTMTAIGVACVILFVFAIAVPNLLRSRSAANEASAVGSLRTLNTAAITYHEKYGHYPASLENFGPPQSGEPSESAADLIDSILASGRKSGYSFLYRRTPSFDRREGYSVDADPVDPGKSGARHFSTDQSGVIRMNSKALDGANERSDRPISQRSEQPPQSSGWPKIARAAELRLTVTSLENTRNSLNGIVQQFGGYIAQLSATSQGNSEHQLSALLRVPSDRLSAAIAELKKLGRVAVESQAGDEITKEHVDLLARLKNARSTESRINDVIQHRTGNVQEVLEAEKESARVRGEIERMEAERQAMENRVEFASISLTLTEEYQAQLPADAGSARARLRNAFVTGLSDAWESLVNLLVWAIAALPTALLWLAVFYLPLRWLWRRWKTAALTSCQA
jgi:hypothetical protein